MNRYLHHAVLASIIVVDGSEEMDKLLDTSEWFKLKTDIKAPVPGEEPEPEEVEIDLDALNDNELKALGQKYKIKSYASMSRDTLITRLKELKGANDVR